MTADKKPLPQDLIDGLLANYKKPEDLIGEDGLLKQLTKALVERALQAEMDDGLLTESQALNIASRLMRENQKACFDLQGTRSAIQKAAQDSAAMVS